MSASWPPGPSSRTLTDRSIGYCSKIYFDCHFSGSRSSGSHLISLGSSTGTLESTNALQAYNRVKGLIKSQWRGFIMVLIVIADVIFFCVIFLIMDRDSSPSAQETANAEPWLICLALHPGQKEQCLDLALAIVLNQSTVVAVLVLLVVCSCTCPPRTAHPN